MLAAATRKGLRNVVTERPENVRRGRVTKSKSSEFRWKNADDLERDSTQRDVLANHCGVSAEPGLPKTVTEDQDAVSIRMVLLLREIASELHRHAERIEEARGNPEPPHQFRVSCAGHRQTPVAIGDKRIEKPGPAAPFDQRSEGCCTRRLRAGVSLGNRHQALRCAVRKWAQQH